MHRQPSCARLWATSEANSYDGANSLTLESATRRVTGGSLVVVRSFPIRVAKEGRGRRDPHRPRCSTP
jgi:hypothetical protein